MQQAEAEAELLSLLELEDRLRRENRLGETYAIPYHPSDPTRYGPYEWQVDVHNAGPDSPERCLIAANRVGKTQCAGAEVAIHATGLYPDWWEGLRFTVPVRIWCGSDTNETSRDIVQASLLGDPVGTGWIPKKFLGDITTRQAGVKDVVDTIRVKHASGGWSKVTLKTYEQGRKKWQGTSQHFVWLDEEPPHDIYTEAQTRTLDVKGSILMTFTPLEGATEVVRHFVDGKAGSGIYVKNVTWADAPHLDEAEKARLLLSYPEHERDTRALGLPMMGSGAVFPIGDDKIMCKAFAIPDHFARIVGIDFGIDHPAAGVWLAWDRDADIVYLYDAYKAAGHTPVYHADAIKSRGKNIPVSWPHDGMQRGKADGVPLRDQYAKHGANMLWCSARYDDQTGGAQPREPVVQKIYEAMLEGRFRVFEHLTDWFEEKRMYHRKDGKIVAERDDLMSATAYAVMMLRFAEATTRAQPQFTAENEYDPLA